MRTRILIVVLVLIATVVSAQDTISFYRLPPATRSLTTDYVPVVRGDTTFRMTIALFNDYILDSLGVHSDTLNQHNSRIAVVENAVDTLATDVTTNAGGIATNAADISTTETDVINIQDSLLAAYDSLAVHVDSLNAHNSRLGDLESATVDHGGLTGLSGDDHTQYYNTSRIDAWYITKDHGDLVNSGDSTHAVIDAHLRNEDNPHAVTAYDLLPDTTGNSGKFLKWLTETGLVWGIAAGGSGSDSTWAAHDTIVENTSSHGVLVESLLIKDSTINIPNDGGIYFGAGGDTYIREDGSTANTLTLGAGGQVGMDITSTDLWFYDDLLPGSTLSYDFGGPASWWRRIYGDTLYLRDVDSKIYHGASDNLTFYDSITGAKTLAQLAATGDSSFVSASIGTINEFTTGSGVSIDGVTLKDGGITTLASGSFSILNPYASRYARINLYEGDIIINGYTTGAYSGNYGGVYVANGNAILRSVNGATTRSLSMQQTNILLSDGAKVGITHSSNDYTPADSTLVTKKYVDAAVAGGSSADSTWISITAGTVNVDSTDHEIWTSGDDLKFKDGNNPSGYTLTELAAGGAAADSVFGTVTIGGVEIDSADAAALVNRQPLDTAVVLKADTIQRWTMTIGTGVAADSALFVTGAVFRMRFNLKDTLVHTNINVLADSAGMGATPNFGVQVRHKITMNSGSPTNMYSSAQTVAGSEPVTTGESFSTWATNETRKLAPGHHIIEVVLSDIVKRPSQLIVSGDGYLFNAE